MLVAPRGLPLAELEKHIDGATLDLGRIAASWEKEGKKVSFDEGLQGYPMLSHWLSLALAVVFPRFSSEYRQYRQWQ